MLQRLQCACHGQTDVLTDGQLNKQIEDGKTEKWLDRRMDRRTDRGWFLFFDSNVIFIWTPFRAGRVCSRGFTLLAGPGRGRGGFGGIFFSITSL